MKVIKSRLSTTEPKRCICEECGAELEYEPCDVHVGWMGVGYVTCPECGRDTAVSDERKAKPTWPLTFHHTCKENGAVDLDDERVDSMVDEVVNRLKKSDDDYPYAMTGTGNTVVFGLKFEDSIEIYVTKNYWEDTIFLN